jgi:hypothetical protein
VSREARAIQIAITLAMLAIIAARYSMTLRATLSEEEASPAAGKNHPQRHQAPDCG